MGQIRVEQLSARCLQNERATCYRVTKDLLHCKIALNTARLDVQLFNNDLLHLLLRPKPALNYLSIYRSQYRIQNGVLLCTTRNAENVRAEDLYMYTNTFIDVIFFVLRERECFFLKIATRNLYCVPLCMRLLRTKLR